jgi:catechol 2,3-dioxygenase-like lactoylglutathione lyase family enzyme
MKIRTIYFKVPDARKAANFWQAILQVAPHKNSDNWQEFMCGNIRLGLLLNDFGDEFHGSGCVPVFEFPDDQLQGYIDRAIKAGGTVVLDGLNDPNLKSFVMRDPFGHEFELSKFHD